MSCSSVEAPLGERRELGVVAFTAAEEGNIVVVDVATGEVQRVGDDRGRYGAVSLSRSGEEVAYARSQTTSLNDEVYVAGTATGEFRQVQPGTGEYMPSFQWLDSGWMWYPYTKSGEHLRGLLAPGGSEARAFGGPRTSGPAESIASSKIAYVGGTRAASNIVVEFPDGSESQVFDIQPSSFHVLFTPDGEELLFSRERDGMDMLASLELSSGRARDVSPAAWPTLREHLTPGLSKFSPDGRRLLQERSRELVSVSLDGSGEELIARGEVSGGYTALGDVVVYEGINTEEPPDDTPEYVYSGFIVSSEGESIALFERSPDCRIIAVSDSGNLIGVTCARAQQTTVLRPDGSVVFETMDGALIGFDRQETGIVVRSDELRYQSLDGKHDRLLGDVHAFDSDIDEPYVDYAP